jgi:hypothetical protein
MNSTKDPQASSSIPPELLEAARAWWQSHRPQAYDLAQHLRNPAVNCPTAADQALACAVARAIGDGALAGQS